MTERDCPFCRIVTRDDPAEIVHETEAILAFRDLRPRAPTHVLLIPKDHVTDARAIDGRHAPMLAELFAAATDVARAEGVDRSGWRLVANVGPDAGQSVFHLHVHLLGGRPMSWPPG